MSGSDEIEEAFRQEATWFAWFLVLWVLWLEALVPGALAVAWWIEGMRNANVAVLFVVAVAAMLAAGWWMERNQRWRR